MDAYIVAGFRSAVGKSGRGALRFTHAVDLSAQVINKLMAAVPNVSIDQVDDVIVGSATPEGDMGSNIARMIAMKALKTDKIPGVTVNRFCSSGLETIATASAKINAGHADCIIAGGVETMSSMPMGGWRPGFEFDMTKENPSYYWGMGLTAEAVAAEYKVSREAQDEFAFNSHMRSLKANAEGTFKADIAPISVSETYLDANEVKQTRNSIFEVDEGPRAGTTLEALAKLRPVFNPRGSVTAGNSSQTSDGAAFVMVVNEKFLKENNLTPIARLVSFSVAGVPPRIMGIGPIYSIPKALKQAGLTLDQMDLIELNEAFSSQSVAIANELNINPDILNVNGGAISLGHPMGATGAKLSVQIFNELKRRQGKYGMVTMCVGSGQGATGIYEMM
jgi:acetyl-CoA acyltransferase